MSQLGAHHPASSGAGHAAGGTRAERLATALDDFIRSSPDVEAAAVVSFDGLPMASALPDSLEEDRLGAMSAALLSLGEQAAIGLGRGALNQVFIEGEHGFVFLMSAEDQAVLAAIARRTAKIGFMLFEMRRAAERIGGVLDDVADLSDLSAPSDQPDLSDLSAPADEPDLRAADSADDLPRADDLPHGDDASHPEAALYEAPPHTTDGLEVVSPDAVDTPHAAGWH